MENHSVQHIIIDSERDGQRLDNFLLSKCKGIPKSHIYRIIRSGEVRANKKRIKPSYRVCIGDDIRIPPIRVSTPETSSTVSENLAKLLESRIIHEDQRLLVLNKPAGLAVHGGSGINIGVIEAIRQMRPYSDNFELVHRLDRETSGCLLIAKKRSLLRELHELIRNGDIEKNYMAVLSGKLRKTKTIDVPLRKNTLKSGERVVIVAEDGKPCLTDFIPLEIKDEKTLTKVVLHTGRTHQIRVHAQHMGFPVEGDLKYGNRERKAKRMHLHAERIAFGFQEFTAPIGDEFWG